MSVTHSAQRVSDNLKALSEWVDGSYPDDIDREAALWRRVAKISEECGEVIAALIGYVGENPRKGVTHSRNDVIEELLDVAIAALAAVEHIQGNRGDAFELLGVKVQWVVNRALASGAVS